MINPSNSVQSQTIFEEFFEMGLPEGGSPFLTPSSRKWGSSLALKAALLGAFLLLLAFILSFYPQQQPLASFLLILVYFLAGIPSLIESIEDLLHFEVNIDVLMTLAAFSSVLIGSGMEGGLLLVLFSLSGSIEETVENKAKSAISSLHKLSPTKGCVVYPNGLLIEKSIKDIGIGSKILVKSGEIVPLDGKVIEGISSVNLVHLTGENMPITKKLGDMVAAGARNLEGALILIVEQTSNDSTLMRIIQLVTQAQEAKPKLQRWFDKLSKGYAIAIILLAGLFALTLPFFLKLPFLGIEGSIYRSLAFLIAASPCALILAIPIAYLSAISNCARHGILLKGGITLDALAQCQTIAFDKTGTLTTGKLSCQGFESLEPVTPQTIAQALSIAQGMESNVVHPIAQAILDYAQAKGLTPTNLKNYRSIAGYGLEATIQLNEGEQHAYIGHLEYISHQLSLEVQQKLQKKIALIQAKGELLSIMLFNQQIFIFRFRDTLRPKIKETIATIKNKWGWHSIMLTGDHESVAQEIAQKAGIDEYYANLRPEDKLSHVTKLADHKGLAMVGDGINDAPALARATVGISMGQVGSAAAIDASDVILLNDNIELLDWLISKAHQTQTIVRQNLIIAISAIFIAAFPALAGLIPLWLAVILHEGGTVLVGLNALRLFYK